jgi:DNA-binding beta-propeller fold protein YncE
MAIPRLESTIHLKASGDKESDNEKPVIRSLAIMHGHFCIVLDKRKKYLKVVNIRTNNITSEIGFDTDNKEIDKMELEFLWGVACVGRDQLAMSVSLKNKVNKIIFLTVSDVGSIRKTNQELVVPHTYFELAYSNDHFYGCRHNEIHVIDMTGHKVTSRTMKTASLREEAFQFLHGIAVSPDHKIIYVTDGIKHIVTSLDLDGNVKAVYKDVDLLRPWGITVDNKGYVYVCSWHTSSILQLTANPHKVQVLVTEVFGTRLTFSDVDDKLCVYSEDSIDVYDMSGKETDPDVNHAAPA